MTAPFDLAQALFAPRSIALIGASGDPAKNTSRPQQFLRRHGYAGHVYPVNPGRDEVLGEHAYREVTDIEGPVDQAFVMVPAPQVLAALEQCARKGVPVVTVYSDGFAETGEEGAAMQRALAARARALGVRLLGPNCIGVINIPGRVPLSVNAALACDTLPAGRTAFVSQSGSMLGTVLSRGQGRGMGFSKMVSVGNEADLGVGEIVRLLVDDPDTDTILLFLESLSDAGALADAARRAHRAGKAMVAYKLGRSQAGAQLAVSHTGALAGSDAVSDAFLREHGIVRVELLETLIEIAPLLRAVPGRARDAVDAVDARAAATAGPVMPRVAVVSTTGGGAAVVVDRLGLRGLAVSRPTPAFIAAMAAQGVTVRDAPIIDLTLAATSAKYEAVLRGLLEADFCDAVLAVVGTSAQYQPQLAVQPILRAAASAGKPLAVFLAPQADASLALLAESGVAAFRTPEACADALAGVLTRRAPRAAAVVDEGLGAALAPLFAAAMGGDAGVARQPVFDEDRSLRIFDALGVRTVARALLVAPPWIHAVPYPVAVKLVSEDLPHKTEAGAVRLDVRDDAALAQAIGQMTETVRARVPGARVRGVLVQSMQTGIAEALVGYRHDASAGPVVMLGAGGRLAELLRDVSLRMAPVVFEEAQRMVEEVAAFAPARGYRGMARGDVDALARVIVALGRLATLPGQPVAEAEINPVLVQADGVVAVDGLVVLRV